VTREAAEEGRHEAVNDIDLFEVNEAFASVVLRFIQAFDIDPARRSTSTAAPSPWAIRSARPAR
jgi:acetyl-CoA C-acetyltransferase